jgi:ethanolamine ammonia-lyase small subunit
VRIASTPARIGVGRAGVRYRTGSLLGFLEDHAAARDAVTSAVDPALLASLGLLPLRSAARDRTEFLLRPDLGRKLDAASIERVRAQARRDCQVQVVVCDGLSATALGATLPRVLPPLLAALQAAGLTVGTPCFVANGRLVVGDEVGRLVNADVLCTLLGERPGLVTAESLGGYVTWLRVERIHEALRRMISNVHAAGLPPEEGARQLAALCASAVRERRTGVEGAG